MRGNKATQSSITQHAYSSVLLPERANSRRRGSALTPTLPADEFAAMSRALADLYHAVIRRATQKMFPLWQRLGVHVTPVHYYQPVPDTRRLPDRLWTRRLSAPGIDF